MDIDYFLKQRTKFVRYFYEKSSSTFITLKDDIENAKEPYSPKYYPEQDEPAYLEEWLEADMGLDTVSQTCLSMLSSSLHLFMKSWFDRLEKEHGMEFEFNYKKRGWFREYIRHIKELDFKLENCRVEIDVLEQIVLARNRVQHPEEITSLRVSHATNDMKKYPNPFFVRVSELTMATEEDGGLMFWFPPSVVAENSKMEEAISSVENFASWLESEYWVARNA